MPYEVGVGRTCGGVEEDRSPPRGAREAASSQGHHGHGGDGVPQEELAPTSTAVGVYVRDDPGCPLGWDADARGAGVGYGDSLLGLEDHAPRSKGFPGGANAP